MKNKKLFNWWSGSGGSVVYSSEYQAVLNESATSLSATPTASQKLLQDTFLTALKDAGILTLTDVLKVKATNGSPNFSDINWKAPTANKSIRVKAPTFLRNDGFKTNGLDNYTDENWAPNTGVNYTQNSGEIIVYYKDLAQGVFIDGCRDVASANASLISPVSGATQSITAVNSTTNNTTTNAQLTTAEGMYFFGRANGTTEFIRKGAGVRVTQATISTGRSARTYKNGVLDSNGTLGQWHTRKNLLWWSGGLLSVAQEDAFKAAWDTYYAAISAEAALPTLGTLYNKNTWADLSDFTNNGSTVNVVSNQLEFSGGVNNLLQSLDISSYGYTGLERWKIVSLIKPNSTPSGTTYGFGVGVRSASPTIIINALGRFYTDTSGNAGKCQVWGGSGIGGALATSTAIAFSANDQIELTVEIALNVITVSARNVTTASATVTTSYTFPNVNPFSPNLGRFAFYSFGGTFTVNSAVITSNEVTSADILIAGDSKVVRYVTTAFYNRFAHILSNYWKNVIVNAGGYDRTSSVLNKVPEIIALAPKVVLLAVGSNDIRDGVSFATYSANIDSIDSQLTAVGVRVIHLLPFKEGVIDVTPLKDHIVATKSAANIIDTYTPVIALDADLIHPNDAGNVTIASTIVNSLQIPVS